MLVAAMENDIIEEILLRLPVKELVRCKILSKRWYNFISCCNRSVMVGIFCTDSSLSAQVSSNQVRFLPTSIEGRRTSMLLKKRDERNDDAEEEVILGEQGFPLSPPDESLTSLGFGDSGSSTHILGSSNGFLLTCLEPLIPMHYFVINPINKQWLALPTPNTQCSWVAHGFICHSKPPNPSAFPYFKVVRALCPGRGVFSSSIPIEIFSSDQLLIPGWKQFNVSAPFSFYLHLTGRPAVISEKGLIYFKASIQKQLATSSTPGVVFFDQKRREECCLQLIEFPPKDEEGNTCDCFDMSAGLILYARHHRERGQLQIWMLNDKDDSTSEWSLRHNVNFHFTVKNYPNILQGPMEELFCIEAFHPLNPQVLFLGNFMKKFFYDVENSRLELLCDDAAEGRKSCYKLFPFTYGLVGRHFFLDC
ncbi:hypothetical protein ACHQM5_004818 [Ranunculus cassubicifolius]